MALTMGSLKPFQSPRRRNTLVPDNLFKDTDTELARVQLYDGS